MNLSRTIPASLTGVFAVTLAACAHDPGKELIDARRAYDRAAASSASQLAPAKLYEAKQALQDAEKANEKGDQDAEQDLAYVAHRRADLAMVYGNTEATKRDKARSMAAQRDILEHQTEKLAANEDLLQQERTAREEVERQLDSAMSSLAEIAKVEKDPRGVIITLEGSVIFKTNSADLLPVARNNLEQVAKVLLQYPDKRIAVEGHTDSRGKDAYNLRLSRERAEAVREFMVSKGVKSDQIVAVGRGESAPVAANETAEGRANNRRVEIVVEDTAGGDQKAER